MGCIVDKPDVGQESGTGCLTDGTESAAHLRRVIQTGLTILNNTIGIGKGRNDGVTQHDRATGLNRLAGIKVNIIHRDALHRTVCSEAQCASLGFSTYLNKITICDGCVANGRTIVSGTTVVRVRSQLCCVFCGGEVTVRHEDILTILVRFHHVGITETDTTTLRCFQLGECTTGDIQDIDGCIQTHSAAKS